MTEPVMVIQYVEFHSKYGYYWAKFKEFLFWRVWDHMFCPPTVICRPAVLSLTPDGLNFDSRISSGDTIEFTEYDIKEAVKYINDSGKWYES